jgi:hypothetical protein
MGADCFYESVVETESLREDAFSGTFIATDHTTSPWSAEHQHAGPAAALLLRAAGMLGLDIPDAVTTQASFDILAPIPRRAAIAVSARIVKAGRLAALIDADLTVAGMDQVIMRMSAWRLRRSDQPVTATLGAFPEIPAAGDPSPPNTLWGPGYVDAMSWRVVNGDLNAPGSATVWASPKVNLVDDEPARGAQLVALVADAANGVSALADPREVGFVNTDLNIHLVREPAGDAVWMSAESFIQGAGVGMSTAWLGDENGLLGQSNQSLFVGRQDDE